MNFSIHNVSYMFTCTRDLRGNGNRLISATSKSDYMWSGQYLGEKSDLGIFLGIV